MELLFVAVGSDLAPASALCIIGSEFLDNAKLQIPKHVCVIFMPAPPNDPGRSRSVGFTATTICR